jgi:hypothetical protein
LSYMSGLAFIRSFSTLARYEILRQGSEFGVFPAAAMVDFLVPLESTRGCMSTVNTRGVKINTKGIRIIIGHDLPEIIITLLRRNSAKKLRDRGTI